MQRLLVKTCKSYHLNGAIILKPKAEKNKELLQASNIIRKYQDGGDKIK